MSKEIRTIPRKFNHFYWHMMHTKYTNTRNDKKYIQRLNSIHSRKNRSFVNFWINLIDFLFKKINA